MAQLQDVLARMAQLRQRVDAEHAEVQAIVTALKAQIPPKPKFNPWAELAGDIYIGFAP